MLHRTRQARVALWRLADGGLFALALLTGYALRSRLAGPHLPELEGFEKYVWLAAVAGVLGPAALGSQGFYDWRRPQARWRQVAVAARGGVFVTLGLVLLQFLLREQFARSVVIFAGLAGAALAHTRWEAARWLAGTRLAREQLRRRVIWIGAAEPVARLRAAFAAEDDGALDTVAELDPAATTPSTLAALLREQSPNLAVVAPAGADPARVAPLLEALAREGVELLLHPSLPVRSPEQLEIQQVGGETLLWLRAQAAPHGALLVKQILDFALGALLLLTLAPLVALLALAVRLTSPGPAFFRQTRAGLNGRPFTMWKLRTMRADAEAAQPALAARNEMRGPVFKLAADPRVTPLGRWLRRHGLDELPQLWHVVRGEMSLVGPRPLPVEEIARIADTAQRRRLSVRPGLTCLWQVGGRNNIADFDEWVRLDLAYIDQWSLALDVKILLATIPAVLFGRGGR